MSKSTGSRRKKMRLQKKMALWGYLFVLPGLLLLIIFRFIPMITAAYLSLTRYDLFTSPQFVGIQNYLDLLRDRVFLQSVKVSFFYTVGSVIPALILALILAMLTIKVIRFGNIFRTLIFIPVVLAPVVVAILWRFLFFEAGMVNTMLGYVNLPSVPWLTTPKTAILALILIGIWRASPYFMVIFTAGLQSIPSTYYEAGRMDGTNAWTEFWHITLPLLKPVILLSIVMAVITALKVFAIPQLMTEGGPAGATEVIPLLIYKTGFEFFKMGRASAMSIILLAIMMVFSLIQIRLFSERK